MRRTPNFHHETFAPTYGWLSLLCLMAAMFFVLMSGCAAARFERHGDRALNRQDPVEARWNYEQALQLNPDLTDRHRFRRKLHVARREASVAEGRIALRGGRHDEAIAHFNTALVIAADHEPAQRGLSDTRHAAARMHFAEALDHADEDRLDAARQSLHRALDYESDHQFASAALASLDDEDAGRPEVVAAYREGQAMAADKRLPEAVDAFARAIRLDGAYLPARAALGRNRRTLSRATDLSEQGVVWLGDRDLDRAIESLRSSLELYPHAAKTRHQFSEAQRLRARADKLTTEARVAMAGQDWSLARSRFESALVIFPGHADARHGGHEVALTRARADQQAGRWGAALLHALDAKRYLDDDSADQALDHARARVRDRIGFSLYIRLADAVDALPALSAEFAQAMRERMRHETPGFLKIDPPADLRPESAETVTVAVLRLDVDTRVRDRRHKTYSYDVDYDVPNPKLPRLEARVDAYEDRVDDCRRAYRRLWDDYCDAKARADKSGDPHDRERADRLDRRARKAKHKLRDAERELRDAKHKLACEPATVTLTREERWPYILETYRLEGELLARLELEPVLDAAGVKRLVKKDFQRTDTTIDDPNPTIGLHEDPLTLPTEVSVRGRLLEAGVKEATEVSLNLALERRAAALERRSVTLTEVGRSAEALEAAVDAALLREPISRKFSWQQLETLRHAFFIDQETVE